MSDGRVYVCETAPFFLLCERTKRTWKRRGITSYGLGSHRCLSSELSSVSSSARPTCSPAVMMSFNCAPNETLAPRLPTVRCWCTFPLGRFFLLVRGGIFRSFARGGEFLSARNDGAGYHPSRAARVRDSRGKRLMSAWNSIAVHQCNHLDKNISSFSSFSLMSATSQFQAVFIDFDVLRTSKFASEIHATC